MAIAMKEGSPFGLAGLWENWRNPNTGEWERAPLPAYPSEPMTMWPISTRVSKRLKTAAELVALLNAELRKQDACTGVSVDAIMPFDLPGHVVWDIRPLSGMGSCAATLGEAPCSQCIFPSRGDLRHATVRAIL
jgi:hypothetical protein